MNVEDKSWKVASVFAVRVGCFAFHSLLSVRFPLSSTFQRQSSSDVAYIKFAVASYEPRN